MADWYPELSSEPRSKRRRFRMTAMQRAIVLGPWARLWSPKDEKHYFIPCHVYMIFRCWPRPCGIPGCIGCAGNYGEHKTRRS